jgi:hypothetical protein
MVQAIPNSQRIHTMLADSDIQAWLAMSTAQGMVIIEPAVRSATTKTIDYTITIDKTGAGGTSLVNQSGRRHVDAGVAIYLSKNLLSLRDGEQCNLTMVIREDGVVVYRNGFSCMPPK